MALVLAAGLDILHQRLDRIRFHEEEAPVGLPAAAAVGASGDDEE
jgi:hypothetical protein